MAWPLAIQTNPNSRMTAAVAVVFLRVPWAVVTTFHKYLQHIIAHLKPVRPFLPQYAQCVQTLCRRQASWQTPPTACHPGRRNRKVHRTTRREASASSRLFKSSVRAALSNTGSSRCLGHPRHASGPSSTVSVFVPALNPVCFLR